MWLVLSIGSLLFSMASAQEPSTPDNGRNTAAVENESDEVLADYSDAANYQTGGALVPAIDAWNSFLKKYPGSSLAPSAAHYLGVCHMQSDPADYAKAASAFSQAVENKEYDLREESLANLGLCLFSMSADLPEGDSQREKILRRVGSVYGRLLEEFPKSAYRDRAHFYRGESAFALGEDTQAIKAYDRLLGDPKLKESPLRCDAFYARGIAQEQSGAVDAAIRSFKQYLNGCGKETLVDDVQLRLGDLAIASEDFTSALKYFEAVGEDAADEDYAYSLLRGATALSRMGQADAAARRYSALTKSFPDSPYAAEALMSAGRNFYSAGSLDEAAQAFERVLAQEESQESPVAAHWLARISLDREQPGRAVKLAAAWVDRSKGKDQVDLMMDLGDAFASIPQKMTDSANWYEKAYRANQNGPTAPRALYNAAFSAIQAGNADRVLALTKTFQDRFGKDELIDDVLFLRAETFLSLEKAEPAEAIYDKLLAMPLDDAAKQQRANWVLRAAATKSFLGKLVEAESVLAKNQKLMASVGQAFDAQLLLGQARLALDQPSEAAKALKAAIEATPNHPRYNEARILYGQALAQTGESDAQQDAIEVWKSIITDDADSGMAAQAQYKLGQLALDQQRFSNAITRFAAAADQTIDPSLQPYATYSLASTYASQRKPAEAADKLEDFEARFKNHPLTPQVKLTRGMAFRSLGRLDDSKRDLESFLKTNPSGEDLGDALYELSLIATAAKDYPRAASYLSRVLQEVPQYASKSKVLYELAWSLEEGGQEKEGRQRFAQLADEFPEHPLSADANYFLGQKLYADAEYPAAIERFNSVVSQSSDQTLVNKSLYRLGWSHYKIRRFEEASKLFDQQLEGDSEGPLSFDAFMMSAECEFKAGRYREALEKFERCRERIRRENDRDSTLKVASKSRVRQLALLHAGQSAAQLGDFAGAIEWYDELRDRFPSSDYLAQVFYESAYAQQQLGNEQRALKLYSEVAENYRSEIGARSRFMIGEIYFASEQFEKAVPEFQRVMFGYGAEQAPTGIKNWQAKSGFEAGRCCEVLQQRARTDAAKFKAKQIGLSFYRYVIEKHPTHELADQARERLKQWEEK